MPPRKKKRTDSNPKNVPRRSTRAVIVHDNEGIRPTGVANQQEYSGDDADVKSTGPATTISKRIILKGRLQTLPEIAIEIQLMIYDHLESRDLHHLSRTCKKFRQFFLNRALNEKLWLRARENAGHLPARPPFMSEPAFIHLLYAPHCHNCGAPVRKVLPGCFIRLCTKCLPERTVWYPDVCRTACEIAGGQTSIFLKYLGIYRLPGYCAVHNFSERYTHRNNVKRNRILKEDFDRFIEQITEQLGKPPKGWNFKTLRAIFTGIEEKQRGRLRCARAISAWFENQKDGRKAQLEDVRKQRFETIIARLREAGWDREVDILGDAELHAMSRLPIVRQPSKLTESAWQKVLASLDKLLNDTRAKLIERELRDTLRARFALVEDALRAHYVTLPRQAYMDCRPQYIDFAFMPECRALLDVPVTETVAAEQVAAVIPDLATRWHAEWKTRFTDYIRPYLGDIAPDVDPLELAIASFDCDTDCQAPLTSMRYPNLLVHKCYSACGRSVHRARKELEQDDAYTRTAKSLKWSSQEWQEYEGKTRSAPSGSIPFHIALPPATDTMVHARQLYRVNTMRRIVCALGLDPGSATFDDLERCDVWLRCGTCEAKDRTGARQAWRWAGAYEHETNCHCDWMYHYYIEPEDSEKPKWERADAEDMAQVRERALARRKEFRWYGEQRMWCCSLCPEYGVKGRVAMKAHLEERHCIADAEEAERDGVIYLHPSEGVSAGNDRSILLDPHAELPTENATENSAGQ